MAIIEKIFPEYKICELGHIVIYNHTHLIDDVTSDIKYRDVKEIHSTCIAVGDDESAKENNVENITKEIWTKEKRKSQEIRIKESIDRMKAKNYKDIVV